jgi:hypothetical protein
VDPLRSAVVRLVRRVQAVPYAWPGPADADAVRRNGTGTCASKHALLAEELAVLGIASCPLIVLGPLIPAVLDQHPAFADATDLLEVHELLTVISPWAGPVRVDVTWDPPLVHAGLAGTLDWNGSTDMVAAVASTGAGWAVPGPGLRDAKLGLRRRLYTPAQQSRRDAALQTLNAWLAQQQQQARHPNPAGRQPE